MDPQIYGVKDKTKDRRDKPNLVKLLIVELLIIKLLTVELLKIELLLKNIYCLIATFLK